MVSLMPDELLQRYSRHVYFSEEDQGYIALCSEFKHLSAFGGTPDEALRELDEVLEAALEIHAEEGWPIPRPEPPPEPEGLPSGRFVTRLPKTLHARLIRQARREGVSQNQLVLSYVAAGLGAAHAQETASAEMAEEGAGDVAGRHGRSALSRERRSATATSG
jgi:predicted RNase H-like HicB family nuclease